MAITIEFLSARQAALKQQLDQIVANANALQGALQECSQMIARLSEPEVLPPAPEDKTPEVKPEPKKAVKLQ
jgi:hypothetical protein